MGKNTMVEISADDAAELIKKLDSIGKPPSLVAWFYYEDVDEWRLLLAGKAFEEPAAKQEAAYKILIEAMAGLQFSSLSASDIKIVPMNSSIVAAIHSIVHTGPTGIGRVHLVNTTLNGIFMKEVVILRSANS